jgi:hypothetical protein
MYIADTLSRARYSTDVAITAAGYLRETDLAMKNGYREDCVAHACRLAELLLAEGKSPWIGRIHEAIDRGDAVFHGPLIPRRFPMLTWNTHYVCCCDGEVHDPLAGTPVPHAAYARTVFGRDIEIDVHLDAAATRRLIDRGELRISFRLGAGAPRRSELS